MEELKMPTEFLSQNRKERDHLKTMTRGEDKQSDSKLNTTRLRTGYYTL
jgi:hypothetical protein